MGYLNAQGNFNFSYQRKLKQAKHSSLAGQKLEGMFSL